VPQYPFLSEKWIGEARKIRDKYSPSVSDAPPIAMNLIITEVPFGSGSLDAHLDSSSGRIELDEGHLEKPDVSITTDYGTAKTLFVDQDPTAAMQAFMSGRIRVQGDLGKLLSLQELFGTGSEDDAAREIARKIADQIKAVTQA
jgi:putative sterol carrier protein